MGNLNNHLAGGAVKPMLADTYKPGRVRRFPAYVQPKLDGHRMLYDSSARTAYSRTGNVIAGPALLLKELGSFDWEDVVLDGELYVHRPGMSFGDMQSMIKSNSPDLEYWVFDVAAPGMPYDARRLLLERLMNAARDRVRVKRVKSQEVASEADIEQWHRTYEGNGYEGIMVRLADGEYEPSKRSASLLKKKRVQDAEFQVVGHAAHGNGTGVVWTCTTDAGQLFKVNDPSFNMDRAPLFNGKFLTVQFQELTERGIPRFGVAKGFRDASDYKPPAAAAAAAAAKRPRAHSPAPAAKRPRAHSPAKRPRAHSPPPASACQLPEPLHVVPLKPGVEFNNHSLTRYDNGPCGVHYMCDCMAWKMQKLAPHSRTCKHLRGYLGDAYENARLGLSGGGYAEFLWRFT